MPCPAQPDACFKIDDPHAFMFVSGLNFLILLHMHEYASSLHLIKVTHEDHDVDNTMPEQRRLRQRINPGIERRAGHHADSVSQVPKRRHLVPQS